MRENRPEIIELFSGRDCCVNFRLEIDREAEAIIGLIGERHGNGSWIQVFWIPLGSFPGEFEKDLEESAAILERVAHLLREYGEPILEQVRGELREVEGHPGLLERMYDDEDDDSED